MKKICFVTTAPITLRTFVIQTAEYLNNNMDVEITFVCDYSEDFANLLPDYINYHPIPMKRGISLQGIRVIKKMLGLFKMEKFDLIQYSTPNASLYASIASRLAKCSKRLYCQWGIRYVGLDGFSRAVFRMIEKFVCHMSTDIRSVSPMNMQFAIDEGLYKADKVKVIGKGGTIGVDLSVFDIEKKTQYRQEIREKYGITNEYVFGFVGRMSKDKGAGELLHAYREITKTHNTKLFIIGDKEINGNVSDELIDWAEKTTSIIFTGYIDSDELVKYFAAFDCYVHPTYREGFGMVLQEAAAMGNAIITTDIPGASEVMERDTSCFLVSAKSRTQLKDAMVTIAGNESLGIQMGKAGRERTEIYFDRNIMLNNQYEDYKELLGL